MEVGLVRRAGDSPSDNFLTKRVSPPSHGFTVRKEDHPVFAILSPLLFERRDLKQLGAIFEECPSFLVILKEQLVKNSNHIIGAKVSHREGPQGLGRWENEEIDFDYFSARIHPIVISAKTSKGVSLIYVAVITGDLQHIAFKLLIDTSKATKGGKAPINLWHKGTPPERETVTIKSIQPTLDILDAAIRVTSK